jgi:ABC-type cobalamin transport system ATPase subunit
MCVLGPNGIGKSTLLRTLVGLQPALGGEIMIAGARVAAITQTELARLVGVVLTERVLIDIPARSRRPFHQPRSASIRAIEHFTSLPTQSRETIHEKHQHHARR